MRLTTVTLLAVILGIAFAGYSCSDTTKSTDREVAKAAIATSVPPDSVSILNLVMGKDKSADYDVHLAVPFRQGEKDKLFIIIAAKEPDGDCRACGFHFSGAILTYTSNEWQIEVRTLDFTKSGFWGTIIEPDFVMIGPERPAMLFSFGSSHQGSISSHQFYYAPVDGVFTEVLDLQTSSAMEEGEQTEEAYEAKQSEPESELDAGYTSHVEWVPGSNPDYYTCKVRTDGTNFDEEQQKLIKYTSNEVYEFTGKVFEKVAQ